MRRLLRICSSTYFSIMFAGLAALAICAVSGCGDTDGTTSPTRTVRSELEPAAAVESWVRQYGSAGIDFSRDVVATDEAVYAVGASFGPLPGQTHAGRLDAYVQKFDPDGNVVWTHQFGSSDHDVAYAVAVEGDSVYAAGTTCGVLGANSNGECDAFIRRIDDSGGASSAVWTRQYGTAEDDEALGIAVEGGAIRTVGETEGAFPTEPAPGGNDVFVTRFDDGSPAPTLRWIEQFGTPGSDTGYGIAVDGSQIYVVGRAGGALPLESSAGSNDGFVRQYIDGGSSASIGWTVQFGTASSEFASGVALDGSSIYVVGATRGTLPGVDASGGQDAFIRRYGEAGGLFWTDQFGSSEDDALWGVDTREGAVAVSGLTDGVLPGQTGAGETDHFARRYAADDSVQWTHQFGTPNAETPHIVPGFGVPTIAATDGGAYAAGTTNGVFPGESTTGRPDSYVLKLLDDSDRDGVPDRDDNCPNTANADQDDFDGDGLGDACDLGIDASDIIDDLEDEIRAIPPRHWGIFDRSPFAFRIQRRVTLIRIRVALRLVDAGFRLERRHDNDGLLVAAHVYVQTIRKRWDGCATRQQPDGNDLVDDCGSQSRVYDRLTGLLDWIDAHLEGPAPCL